MERKNKKCCRKTGESVHIQYAKPLLVKYGSVVVLTEGGGGSGTDIPGTTCDTPNNCASKPS